MKKRNSLRWLCVCACFVLILGVMTACGKSNDAAEKEIVLADGMSEVGASGGKGDALLSEQIEGSQTQESQKEDPLKIIRTVRISAETQHFEDAIREIEGAVASLGGYVGSSEVQGANLVQKDRGTIPRRFASYTLRIPAERLDEFLSVAGNAVHITSTQSTAEDVTNDYYDVEARLSVLETERQLLERMLAESTNVANMISVEERLYDVIYEIESYESALRVYDNKVAYSTIVLQLNEVVNLTVTEETFGSRVKNALSESWQRFVEGAQDFLILLIYALPVILILAALGGVIGGVTVASVKRRRKKNQKSEETSKE